MSQYISSTLYYITILITAAVSKGSPVQVSMIRSIGVVFSFLLQTQNNEEPPTKYAIIGASIIGAIALLMTFETKINEIFESCSKSPSRQENEEAHQPNRRTIVAKQGDVITIKVICDCDSSTVPNINHI